MGSVTECFWGLQVNKGVCIRGNVVIQSNLGQTRGLVKTEIVRYALFTSTVPILLHLIIFYRNTFTSFIFIRSWKSIVKHIYFLHNPFSIWSVDFQYYKSQTKLSQNTRFSAAPHAAAVSAEPRFLAVFSWVLAEKLHIPGFEPETKRMQHLNTTNQTKLSHQQNDFTQINSNQKILQIVMNSNKVET
ncbi:Hypothetical_protein [Hexamita inflata]|uniref:Hypothetical_protein n=1 Tax=Hexamita inflata TaxID=28002 RepID=A0AA86S4V0_9EUKA|nr:Hypothetical protein HINF_LOCUS65725 [Hexamita inflata]